MLAPSPTDNEQNDDYNGAPQWYSTQKIDERSSGKNSKMSRRMRSITTEKLLGKRKHGRKQGRGQQSDHKLRVRVFHDL
jgi:hypothetical protein